MDVECRGMGEARDLRLGGDVGTRPMKDEDGENARALSMLDKAAIAAKRTADLAMIIALTVFVWFSSELRGLQKSLSS